MENSELEKIAKLISRHLGRDVGILQSSPVKGGFQSDAFKLTSEKGDTFFIKKMKQAGEAGYELPERHLFSYKISYGMTKRSGKVAMPIGVLISRGEDLVMLPSLDEQASLYHLQEFAHDMGKSYWELLSEKKSKTKIDKVDLAEVEAIASSLVDIHQGGTDHFSEAVKTTLYNDSLQSILAYPGYFFMVLADFGNEHHLLPRAKHGKFIDMILGLIYKLENHGERLRPLHGDFWGSNIFYKLDGKVSVVDFSRIPYGEPGIDVGYFLAQYLWLYHETGNKYFKKLGEKFIDAYEKKTGDGEIRKTLCLPLGLLALLYCNPRFHPDNSIDVEKSFFKAVLASLKKGELVWGTPNKSK